MEVYNVGFQRSRRRRFLTLGFPFEDGSLQLPDGRILVPNRDKIMRWHFERYSRNPCVGSQWEILYQIKGDVFVFVELDDSSGSRRPRAREVSHEEALAWLVRNNLRLPGVLESRVQLLVPPPPLPAESTAGHDSRSSTEEALVAVREEMVRKPILLGEPGRPCIVNGKEKPPLTDGERAVVTALLDAGSDGLTKDALEAVRPSARRILGRLRKDPDWAKVILMAGRTNGRYRIRS